MAHECRRHAGMESTEGRIAGEIGLRAEQRVGEVADGVPGALDVMNALGINHCCGRDLTLVEAAASAGVSLDALMDALHAAREGAS